MNLQPLYEIKDRLEHAALSGTGLLHEDFRLKRAVENLKPLAIASPVFSRLDSGLQGLLSAPPEARAALLLDVLALTGAVLYTQAKTGVDGELEPLPTGVGTLCPLSYGQARPLLDALTGSGGGRLETVKSAWAEHPEFFADFRILPAVVAGLGDSYGELADFNGEILKKTGSAALPLLKQGFDPAGKKNMARRVEAIAAIEGPTATPWLRELLPQAKKDVRIAVLAALGNDPDNAALLLELAKTERGTNREAVLQALARQDGDAVQEFWTVEVEKHPSHIEFLQDSSTLWASDLAAKAFRAVLELPLSFTDQEIQLTESDMRALHQCWPAVLGKSSPGMLECWRWIDSQLTVLGKLKRGPNVTCVNLGNDLPDWLLESLCAAGPGPLCQLCQELWEKNNCGSRYLPHALLAALLTRPGAEVYEAFLPWAERDGQPRNTQVLKSAFQHLVWSRETRGWRAICGRYDPQKRSVPLYEPLDRRWFDLLFRLPDMGEALQRLIPPEDQELEGKLTAYQYRAVLTGGHFIQEDVAYLRKHGWTEWKGFLDKKARKDGSLSVFAVVRLLNETSLTGPEKAQELRHLEKIVQQQHASTRRPLWPALRVMEQTALWEAE